MIAYFFRQSRLPVILLSLFSTVVWGLQPQYSQGNGVNGSQLTLGQAITLADENNLELRSFRESLGIARGQLTGAKLFPTNPQLDFIYFNAKPIATESTGGAEFSLGLSQEFEIGGQRRYRTRAAQSTINKVEAEVGRVQWMLVGDVRETFYQVLLQQERLDLANQVISLTQDLVSRTRGQFSAGYAAEFEVNFAKLELQKAFREKARVMNRLEVSKYRLNNLLGRPWETEFTSAGELGYQPLEAEVERLKPYAVKNRRDLKSFKFNQQAAQSEINLARSLRIPNLKFSLLYDKEVSANTVGALVSLPIKLFNRNQGGIATSLASLRTAEVKYSFLKSLIEKEVASAYSEVLLASKEVQLLEEGMLGTAEQNMDLVQKAYQRGEAEIIEVITAQRNFVDIKTDYLEALYNFNVAGANLEKVLGGNLADLRK